jgi:glutamine amidotransferase
MTTSVVGIVDSGVANLFHLEIALKRVGASVRVCSLADEFAECSHLILPGVGAFSAGMRSLQEAGLAEQVMSFIRTGRPVLGICLGMQLLCLSSEEGGKHTGLSVIDAEVIRLNSDEKKLPHYGWAKLESGARSFQGSILEGVSGSAYFVHSYKVVPRDPSIVLAQTSFGSDRFCSAYVRDNVCGVQFHPELSARAGLTMLGNFMRQREL